jgi:hypothetical protein
MNYFYLSIRPCVRLPENKGTLWRGGYAISDALRGATRRVTPDREGLEFAGRCDGDALAGRYCNQIPWLQFHILPTPPLWMDDTAIDCTDALRRILTIDPHWTPGKTAEDVTHKLRNVRAVIAGKREMLAKYGATDDYACSKLSAELDMWLGREREYQAAIDEAQTWWGWWVRPGVVDDDTT